MHPILLKVTRYLDEVGQGNFLKIPDQLILNFGKACELAAKKNLENSGDNSLNKFRLRMSNIGRPACQLQMEKAGKSREDEKNKFRDTYGDLIEALAILVMKQAGVNIVSEQQAVELHIAGTIVKGTYDVTINEGDGEKVWDVKSASGWAFKNKFKDYESVAEDDPFGYVSQGFGYAKAAGLPFGGWVVINKEDGQWRVIPAPANAGPKALKHIESNIELINGNMPFKRSFSDVEEVFRKKWTGNRKLTTTCSFCSYKNECWPTLTYRASIPSKGKNPIHIWYTQIDEKYNEQ